MENSGGNQSRCRTVQWVSCDWTVSNNGPRPVSGELLNRAQQNAELPPGPELNSNKPDEPAKNYFIQTTFTAGDLGVAGHVPFEQHTWILELSGNDEMTLSNPFRRFRSYRRNGNHGSA